MLLARRFDTKENQPVSPTAFECFTDIHAGEIFVYNYELKALLSVLKTYLQHVCNIPAFGAVSH